MRLPMSWLRECVETDLDGAQVAARLVEAGVPVELPGHRIGVEKVGEDLSSILVGRIVSVEKHPRSDHLLVVGVDLGDSVVRVVTGAPNAREGMLVPVAPAGTYVAPMKAEVRAVEMAGILSSGVVLSAREAGIGEDASGLLQLPPEAAGAVGRPLGEALGLVDEVLEVETFPNRPDWMGVLGLAREVAAILGVPLREPETGYEAAPERAGDTCDVTVESHEDCPRYVARVIRDVPRGASPWWMVRRLYLAGMRSISPVVDVTNYVMLELGQPLHAFDLYRLAGQRIVVRRARPGESLVTLDGQSHTLSNDVLVIADATQAQALAGIMGGRTSEVDAGTQVVLLEAATFHGPLVRRTARRLGLRTEASARFERQLPDELADVASRRACRLLSDMGARALEGSVDRRRPGAGAGPRVIALRPQRVNQVLGTDWSSEHMASALRRLGFGVEEHGRAPGRQSAAVLPLDVQVPYWRRDVLEEEDLAEEVARLHGYGEIPVTLPRSTGIGRLPQESDWPWQVRRALAATGLFEVVTYTFMSPLELRPLGLPDGHEWLRALPVANPLAAEQSHLRTALVPGLIRVARLNVARGQGVVRVFEVGHVFRPAGQDPLPREPLHAGIALLSVPALTPKQWYEAPRALDFFDLKGVLEAAASSLGLRLDFAAAEVPGFHPGRTARIEVGVGGSIVPVGVAGELHPAAAERLDLPGRLYLAEIDLEALRSTVRPVQVEALPRFPAVQRDLALLVPAHMAASRVEELVREHAGRHAREVRVFDVYSGPGLREGTKGLGITITYRAADRTLSDEEVDRDRAALLQRLETAGIRLRG